MRRFLALARTAALESLAEPLTAVLFLSGFAVTHLAPAFHYHQFGESGRLARECGFSALLVFGLVFATGAAIRTIGRELESGTAAAALALAVPRTLFLAARLAGVLATLILFAAARGQQQRENQNTFQKPRFHLTRLINRNGDS